MQNLLIRNLKKIVTPTGTITGDLRIRDGRFAAVGGTLDPFPDEELIDGTGKFGWPGGINLHSHILLPFMGTKAIDDYRTGTQAALCGGTTTVFDFVIPGKTEHPRDAYATWRAAADGITCCDFGLHQSITGWGASTEEQLRHLAEVEGVNTFKTFLAYEGALDLMDHDLFRALTLAKKLGVVMLCHCENAAAITDMQQRLLAAGEFGPASHGLSRPKEVEMDGTQHFCTMLKLTGATGHIVHLSCEEALGVAVKMKQLGVKVTIETLIQYLTCDETQAANPDFDIAARYVMSPPLRSKKNQEILLAALNGGLIDMIETDHAPFTLEQKRMGLNDFTRIPNGMPSMEDRLRVLYTLAVKTGLMTMERFVEVVSTAQAKLAGIYPQKGAIAVGSHADFVLYDPNVEQILSAKTHHSACDYNAHEGMVVTGVCELVTVRGKVQVRNGEFVGTVGHGLYLPRPCVAA